MVKGISGILVLFLLSLCFAWNAPQASAASVSIVPGTQWLDTSGNMIQAHGGGMIKVGGTYYWFGEDKTGIPYVNVYSSTDLKNFTFEGHALTPLSSGDLTNSSIVERPKVIYNSSTSTYVMYFHLDNSNYSYARVGVATSSSVTGPYTYQGSFQPLGHDSRDMGLYQDSDGTAYLISAVDGNANLTIFQLSSDYLSVSSLLYTFSNVFLEAPAMVKKDGTYFLLTSKQRGWNPTDQQYATSTSISSGWSAWTSIGSSTNYTSQTTFILPIQGSSGTSYMYMADRWNPSNLQDSRYIWLPMVLQGTKISYGWFDQWNIDTAAGTFTVPSTYTNIDTTAWYKIKNVNSGLLMDVSGQSTAPGGIVIQWDDNNGYNQEWQFRPIGNGYYNIVSRNSGLLLEVPGGTITPGQVLQQNTNTGGLNQAWSLIDTGNGTFKIMNVNSLQPADVSGESKTKGTNIIQWIDLLQSNQQWTLIQATN